MCRVRASRHLGIVACSGLLHTTEVHPLCFLCAWHLANKQCSLGWPQAHMPVGGFIGSPSWLRCVPMCLCRAPCRSVTGKYHTVTCLDVMIHYPQDKADAMISHLAGLAEERLIISFAPKTPYYSLLKRIGELFPGPSKVGDIRARVCVCEGVRVRRVVCD